MGVDLQTSAGLWVCSPDGSLRCSSAEPCVPTWAAPPVSVLVPAQPPMPQMLCFCAVGMARNFIKVVVSTQSFRLKVPFISSLLNVFFLMATCRVHLSFQWVRCPISGYAHGNVCLFCLALQPGAPVVRSGLVLPSSHFSPFSAFFCPPLLGTTADLLLWSARACRCVYC